MNGFLLVDKPAGPTSHDVVARVRRLLGEKRCGHTGTLDPFATGLLILCLGRATRLSRFLSSAEKTYVATVHFGYATDTYDRTGAPRGEVRDVEPDRAKLEETLERFRGRQMQQPPAFSAKKQGGKRLYELARKGMPVMAPHVPVEIRTLRLLELEGPRAHLEVSVSSGTYIRSLAHDVGRELGCGAHLSELRRTRVASFDASEAVDLETLERRGPGTSLLAPNEGLRDLPDVMVGADAAGRLVHGRAPRWEELFWADTRSRRAPATVRVLGPASELLAVAELEPEREGVRILLVWAEMPENP